MRINYLPGILLLMLLFQSCSESEDTNEPDLNAVAFSADSHVETSTLPQTILDYITVNYPGLTIVEAEIEDNQNFEIELSDDTELIFNAQGEFLGVDDDENKFDDEEIDPAVLPQNILDFISDNFPGLGIDEAELENNGNYEIELENDIELIFDGDGNFLGQAKDENEAEEGEAEEDINPAELPQVIQDYIAENYPDNTIIEAEVDEDEYEVTLNNGIELEFDLEGNLLSVEDGNGEDDDDDGDDD
ncbi:Putative beta-lactamase-inhibitor-like, PepSY-like [Salegentibacter holothuriorum]|uniref:Putative beta-lactamase-inhibitor-like, PepSY-like n=1 Tax=Salegentibacter holothuriorum TaxID=241145 RepID=A0A1T5C0P6_9FLAO|nr:PepSY-like domain-containing protein [Salegentibacter holothuriorum]SKB52976.1 Putative beta-lactamase-inhibitor-like, PepSY-like [Salegentibacter holothuriorum]